MAEVKIEPFDIKYLSDYYNEFDAEITKYQWPDPFKSIDDAKELLQKFIDEMGRDETIFLSVLSETGEFMGSVEVHGLDEDCPELGVWIKKSEWGKGYAYQALKAALDIAMSKYGKTEFFYEADTRNVGSRKLLDKFKDEYDIEAQAAEALTTDSGKELELQGFILTLKEG
ncbi:MAG: GNAT family N-acetyltransferase [Lachnospiraceae bacterium]|nr:GNAT family N-acetyltransferase [Lachnospiraceae bacterium]